jgi:radical SAM protein with 4Fe4S-binding SPASM domain
MPDVEPPYLVALNLTRRCNLRCEHCYLDAGTRADGGQDELTTDEVKAVVDQIAGLSAGCMVVMTGGEPLLRPDIDELVGHAADQGLMVVLGTNGLGLTRKRIERLQAAGLAGAGISLDSLEPGFHDGFRGCSGAWEKTMAALDACRSTGLVFQVHYSVTDENAHEFEDMVEFAKSAGALALNVFFLVCTGRGEKVTNISARTYEDVLRRVTKAAHDEPGLMIRAKCAPHFKRMALELDPDWPITLAQGYEAGGCLAGSRYCRITPEGGVTACPYMEDEVGSVRTTGFAEIWRTSEQFQALRNPVLEGRCGACEYTRMCGGCRARPFARYGNLMGEDFLCDYTPGGGAVIEPLGDTSAELIWATEAVTRLERVPPFVRRMVRRGVEEFVRDQGRDFVGPDDMAAAARKRFGDEGMPTRFGPGFKRPERPDTGDGS